VTSNHTAADLPASSRSRPGASAAVSKQVLSVLPAPARLLCRAVWRPRYARARRWNARSVQAAAERQAS
jgi:hypothetical protein